ncbi:MAG: DUF1330 domain-containing protein, partial [Pseudomonadota bacterium]
FRDLPRDTPLNMLNLVRVRPWADYGDDRKVTGPDAYAAFGAGSKPVLDRVGGRILWRGTMEGMLIGPADEHWDYAFIAYYPNAEAFLAMLADPDYQQAVIHRTAAVADSRLIRMGEMASGDNFAS